MKKIIKNHHTSQGRPIATCANSLILDNIISNTEKPGIGNPFRCPATLSRASFMLLYIRSTIGIKISLVVPLAGYHSQLGASNGAEVGNHVETAVDIGKGRVK